jgi:hypothetical protein
MNDNNVCNRTTCVTMKQFERTNKRAEMVIIIG